MRNPKTDYGTIILHWMLVPALGLALVSGLRIATEAPDRDWINLFDALLPRESVWRAHMQAATVLVAVSVAYTVYMARSGLVSRIRLDSIRLRGLLGRGQARRGAVNVMLYWIFFITMLSLMTTGGLLFFGYFAGHDVAMLHWYATWVILAFAGLHLLTHYMIGGARQLLRIFRPTDLSPPAPALDAVELLTMLVEQSARLAPEEGAPKGVPEPRQPSQPPEGLSRNRSVQRHSAAVPRGTVAHDGRPPRPRRHTLQANPFVVAVAVAISSATLIVAADREVVDHLEVHRIDSAEAPVLDGDTSDRVWHNIQPLAVMTSRGGNFDGKGETRIEIRAVHDGTWAYFLFTWDDSTRSLKQMPLIKEIGGWRLLHRGYENGDEQDYSEDKFSVLFTTSDVSLAGDRTFHASPHPIPDAPATMTGRGLHYTAAGYADVWQWKATSSAGGFLDDSHFGPPLQATPQQVRNAAPYKGGFAPDPGTANYSDNFAMDSEPAGGGNRSITPRRLPKDVVSLAVAMQPIDLDPNHGERDGARWFMSNEESVPYTQDQDTRIPFGTVIPGVIIAGEYSGDRADVRCAARWAAGRWALEVARRLDTRSQYDVAIRTGVRMRVAAFDHNQIRHTRHVRPIRLEVE